MNKNLAPLVDFETIQLNVPQDIDKDQFNKAKDIIVGVVYRPPNSDLKIFNEYIQELFSKIDLEKKSTYCLGDFNVNLLNIDKHADTHDFADIMFSFSLSNWDIKVITPVSLLAEKYSPLIQYVTCTPSGSIPFKV